MGIRGLGGLVWRSSAMDLTSDGSSFTQLVHSRLCWPPLRWRRPSSCGTGSCVRVRARVRVRVRVRFRV